MHEPTGERVAATTPGALYRRGAVLPTWLDPDTLRWLALAALFILAVVMILVARFVQKMVIRVGILLLLAALGGLIWYQRAELSDCAQDCTCTLLGFDVQVPPDANPFCGP